MSKIAKYANFYKGNQKPVVIDGARTAFVKSFGAFKEKTVIDLYSSALDGLVRRVGLPLEEYDEVLAGMVVPEGKNPNVARDAALNIGLPHHIHGLTLNRACTSSLQTIFDAAKTISFGHSHMILAGGVECLSDVPILYSKKATDFLVSLSKARSMKQRIKILKSFSLKHWIPRPPALAEPLTGLTMGQHAEIMAKKNDISRSQQDMFAVASHTKAFKAMSGDVFASEIIPVWAGRNFNNCITTDDLIRESTNVEKLSKLRPVFDRKYGSLTAGNSSPLTDGAAVTLIADEQRARSLGLKPKARIVDACFIGIDPKDQLLIGPAIAIPYLLKRNNLTVDDIGRFEIHEAFAAQVLSCVKSMASDSFCEKHLGLSKAFGVIPVDRLNVNGGAIAIGHPFGATGSRLVTSLSNELIRSENKYGIIGVCAAGGMAGAMLIENCEE